VSALYREIFTPKTIVAHDTPDEKLLEELRWRYAHEVPPGYKDGAKLDEGIGDFAIWKSILKLGKDRNKDVVFVCGEQKHDWVYRSNKVPLVPRMELCDEFNGHTGQHFGLVSWTRFLELAGAKAETLSEARRAERRATADNHRLMPITKRVRQLLEDICMIVLEGPQDVGTGYELLREGDFEGLVDAFVEAKKLYETIVRPPTGIDILNQLEAVVKEISSLNRELAFLEARMKRSGGAESAKLRYKSEEFLELYNLYERETIPHL
jgi:PIN like domain